MILILHYYKSTVDGVMTSLIDTYFNMRRGFTGQRDVRMKIICPELYLLGVAGYEDYYNFDVDDTQWYEYTEEKGLDVEKYEANDKKIGFSFQSI
jgi:hypothetical protein